MQSAFLLDINFTPYIPSTVIGLIGLLFSYLYFHFKNKEDQKVEQIKSTNPNDRLKAIEANLSELGLSLDTSNLNSKQKYDLLEKALKAKSRKYLIVALTTISLSLIIAVLIWTSLKKETEPPNKTSENDLTFSKKDNLLDTSYAGSMIVEEVIATTELDGNTQIHQITKSFQGCTSQNPCEMQESWSCPANQKIIGVTYQCDGQCGWSYKKRPSTQGDNYAPDYDISDNAKTVTVYRHLDGANPTTVTYNIAYQTYDSVFKSITSDTVYFKKRQPFDVKLSSKNSDGNFTVRGKLKTGEYFNYNNRTIGNSNNLKLLGFGKVGDTYVATFNLMTH